MISNSDQFRQRDALFSEMAAAVPVELLTRAFDAWDALHRVQEEQRLVTDELRGLRRPPSPDLPVQQLSLNLLRTREIEELLGVLEERRAAANRAVVETTAEVRWAMGPDHPIFRRLGAESRQWEAEIEERQRAISQNAQMMRDLQSLVGAWTPAVHPVPFRR